MAYFALMQQTFTADSATANSQSTRMHGINIDILYTNINVIIYVYI